MPPFMFEMNSQTTSKYSAYQMRIQLTRTWESEVSVTLGKPLNNWCGSF